jgi:hypothetical protein
MEKTRPHNPRPIVGLVLLAVGGVAAMEGAARVDVANMPRPLGRLLAPVWAELLAARVCMHDNWHWLAPVSVLALVLLLAVYRGVLLLWHNVIVARLAGTELSLQSHTFRKRPFDINEQISKLGAGQYLIGMTPGRKPVVLSEFDLCTHVHLMGQTGSGKTASVITPLLYQCIREPNRKGALLMDAKGSSENVAMVQNLARKCGREQDLRIFALAYPEWSHSYNPVWPCTDPDATAERIFSVFSMDNEYYRGQAWLMFRNLIRLMAGTGMPFNLIDVRTALIDDEAREHVYESSKDLRAQHEVESQLNQLGRRRLETFTGLYNALADYDHPLLNTYSPTIVLEDVVNKRGICYVNLPANRYPILAPSVGKILLQHLQAIGAMRQIDRARYDQHPFTVFIDELNRFAFPNLVPALCMLRDAKVQFVLSHQSLGDLEQVSLVFTRQVKDNTRCKIFLYENDPDHLEKVSRSYGTRTAFKRTVRFSLGPLWTFLNTGEVSNREVEEFILHPNALKSLAPFGQGYVLLPDRSHPVNLEMLPPLGSCEPQPERLVARLPEARGLNLMQAFVERCQRRRKRRYAESGARA